MYTKYKKELYKYLAEMEHDLKNLQDQVHNLEEREVDLQYAESDDFDDKDYNINLDINEVQQELHDLKIETMEKESEIIEHTSKIHAFEKNMATKMKLPLTQLLNACKKYIEHLKPDITELIEKLPRETKQRYLATHLLNPNDCIITCTLNGKDHDINYTKIAESSNSPDFTTPDKSSLHQLQHVIKIYTALVTHKMPLEDIEKELHNALQTIETKKPDPTPKAEKFKTGKSHNKLFKESPKKTEKEKFYEKIAATQKTLEDYVKNSFSKPSVKKTVTKKTSPKLSP